MTSVAVLCAALLHASWNALAKGTEDRFGLFARMNLVALFVSVPLFFFVPAPAAAAVPWLVVSAVVHVAYSLALLLAYKIGDFNLTYPFARGLGPILVAGFTLGIGEHLSPTAAAGMAVISGSVCVLGLTPWRAISANRPALAAAAATGVSIACYTLVDGFGVRRADSAAGYTLGMFSIQAILTCLLLRTAAVGTRLDRARTASSHRRTWVLAASTSVMSLSAYGLVLWAQTRGNLAAVAALRESSTVVAAVIGWVVFKESMSRTRAAASAGIAIGAALLAVAGAS